MKLNRLGKSDLLVSEIGFGCMSLPDEQSEAAALIHKAVEEGVNFFDTADLYNQGRNEELVGQALKGKRQQVILATKIGNRWQTGEPGWVWDPSKDYIKHAVHDSLRRLGTDYIDLYQLHGGTIDDNFEDVISAFEELREAGYIRWYGISSIRPNVIRPLVQQSNLVSVMMQYSILDRRPEESILDFLAEHQVSVIARGPVAGGLLSDSAENRIKDSGYLGYSPKQVLELVATLKEQLTDASRSLTQLALRYSLGHPAVATVIPGASRMEQLLHNVAAASSHPLSLAERDLIRQWSKANVYQQHR